MQYKKITLLVATGVLAITLSAGVAYAAPDNNPTSTSTVNGVTENVGAMDKVEKHRECGAEFTGILGMDANTLTAKLQAAFNDRIDKAVANGKLTADKAVTMKAKTAAKAASVINNSWIGREAAGCALRRVY